MRSASFTRPTSATSCTSSVSAGTSSSTSPGTDDSSGRGPTSRTFPVCRRRIAIGCARCTRGPDAEGERACENIAVVQAFRACETTPFEWRSTMTAASCAGSQFFSALVVAALAATAHAQDRRDTPVLKPSTLPNPYRLVPDWPTLPASMKGPNGRKWGEVIRVHVAPNGNVGVFHRCFSDTPHGDATCLNRGDANLPILEVNPAGALLKRFGVGLLAHPDGCTVDAGGTTG